MSIFIKNTTKTKQYRQRAWQLALVAVIMGVVFGIAKPALAYTPNDLQCVFQNTCGYDPTDTTQPKSDDCSSARVELIGGDN